MDFDSPGAPGLYGSLMKRNKISYNFYRIIIVIHPSLSRGMDNTIFLKSIISFRYNKE